MTENHEGPVVIELGEDIANEAPSEASPISELSSAPSGKTMQTMAALVARPRSRLVRWFWGLLLSLILFFGGVAIWDLVAGLVARNSILATVALGLLGLFALTCLAILARELATLARLQKVERLQLLATAARDEDDLQKAKELATQMSAFYRSRDNLRWGQETLAAQLPDVFEAVPMLSLVEDNLLSQLDQAALAEIEAASRQVATVTALVPLAFVDVLAALTANIRMIRRIAEIYGGRSGSLGAWRLTRAVLTHLVATGAVSAGDDLLGSIGGSHILGKISRRFGEGLVNGALTARVGVSAMEVCRPMPFVTNKRPRVGKVLRRALSGLFNKSAQEIN